MWDSLLRGLIVIILFADVQFIPPESAATNKTGRMFARAQEISSCRALAKHSPKDLFCRGLV